MNNNIRLMDNGNLMMNDEIIIENPVNIPSNYIANGYSESNNKMSLSVGTEIRNKKYKLVIGND